MDMDQGMGPGCKDLILQGDVRVCAEACFQGWWCEGACIQSVGGGSLSISVGTQPQLLSHGVLSCSVFRLFLVYRYLLPVKLPTFFVLLKL